MTYSLRSAKSEDDVATMASFSILTILETIPEARTDPSIVPNFSHEEMAAMYRKGLGNPSHRYLVAANEENLLVGYGIYVLRKNDAAASFGYLYSRYVLPAHRRQGLAGRMLDTALDWFKEMNAEWAEAHTHPSNTGLKKLFTSRGFEIGPGRSGRWDSVLLKKSLR
jgi:ribosomal protein S18 acetylase RimI-like enzyme